MSDEKHFNTAREREAYEKEQENIPEKITRRKAYVPLSKKPNEKVEKFEPHWKNDYKKVKPKAEAKTKAPLKAPKRIYY